MNTGNRRPTTDKKFQLGLYDNVDSYTFELLDQIMGTIYKLRNSSEFGSQSSEVGRRDS